MFWSRLGWNLVYFVVGRHSGLLPYFFPGLFAAAAFLWPRRYAEPWQWLVAPSRSPPRSCSSSMVWIPYNYFGGGGVLGNRYFMSTYGLLLFLLPPDRVDWRRARAVVRRRALHCADRLERVLGVVQSGRTRQERPAALAAGGNDDAEHPANHDAAGSGARLFGVNPRFQIYFLDDNTFPREGDGFWLRGDSRADLDLKTVDAARTLRLTLSGGDAPTKVVLSAEGGRAVGQDPGDGRTGHVGVGAARAAFRIRAPAPGR